VKAEPPSLAFSDIYADYHARVLRYVASLIGREEAEDVTQEVFAKVARSLATLADRSKLAPGSDVFCEGHGHPDGTCLCKAQMTIDAETRSSRWVRGRSIRSPREVPRAASVGALRTP